jgi:hypothetical protein
MTTIFEVLGRQHGELDTLFRQVHGTLATGRESAARTRFAELSTRLLGMMHAEHSIVYPQFAFLAGLEDEVRRAVREHDQIEQRINHLRLAPLALEAFADGLTQLQCLLADHQETEEWILFPVATLRLSGDDARRIAAEYLAYGPVAMSVAQPSITYDAA